MIAATTPAEYKQVTVLFADVVHLRAACRIWLLRMRALLARVQGDDASYRDNRDRYLAMATSLGFEGHIRWAEAMP